GAQFVTLADGKITVGKSIPLISNKLGNEALSLDGEGAAFADGYFYVIGSHGHPRDRKRKLQPGRDDAEINAKILASSQIVRFTIDAQGEAKDIVAKSKLRDVIKAQTVLQRYADRRLENNGVTIEGIAIRKGRLLAGFRGPSLDDGQAAILSVS